MSSKKSTTPATGNNENLCPLKSKTRKRTKATTAAAAAAAAKITTPHSDWKLAKLTSSTTASPASETAAAQTKEYLAEMGIGMLESSEESCSSSSAASAALALTVSNNPSADENSNEATPNLDAPKYCHQQQLQQQRYRRSMDHSLLLDDSSSTTTSNNTTNNSFVDPNVMLKSGHQTQSSHNHHRNSSSSTSSSNNNNHNNSNMKNNNNYNINSYDGAVQLPQIQKFAILGIGSGLIIGAHAVSPSTSALLYQHTNNTHSPTTISAAAAASGVTRSPLATVACNSYFRNASNIHQKQQQQQQNQQQQQQQLSSTQTHAQGSNSPSSLPSTSRQAAMLRQQHEQQPQEQETEAPRFVPGENFFLYRNAEALRRQQLESGEHGGCGEDRFDTVSDEIILLIFQWLPKKALLRCGSVSRRFSRCASDESLWSRLDLGGRALRPVALENILTRGVAILRLAQTHLYHPVISPRFMDTEEDFVFKLQFLDLSMSVVTKSSLKMLFSHCRQLKKLSLENVPINDDICNEIAKNTNLEALNLAMCTGLEAWTIRNMLISLQNLNSLNISWTSLSVDAVTSVSSNVTPNIMRLNVAGCRKTMFDSHLSTLIKRCTNLLELDLSDCTGLSNNAVSILCHSKMLEYLSLSRCYQIPGSALVDFHNLTSLTYLDVFGMLSDPAMETLERGCPNLGINKFIHSSVARPTVGSRRTSIWGLRTRD